MGTTDGEQEFANVEEALGALIASVYLSGADWLGLIDARERVAPICAWLTAAVADLAHYKRALTSLARDPALLKARGHREWDAFKQEGHWIQPTAEEVVAAALAATKEAEPNG